MKQYFFLVTELVNGKLTPLKITLQSYNAVKFGRTYAEKHPDSLISLYKQPISEIGNLNTFITDPNEDLWEIKKAKEDYYIKKLAGLETGSLMKDATVWFDNKSMPLDTFKAKCLGQILLTGPYKVYIKRTGTQVDKLNTCNMSVTSYTISYK